MKWTGEINSIVQEKDFIGYRYSISVLNKGNTEKGNSSRQRVWQVEKS
jgi:hypothetical protein